MRGERLASTGDQLVDVGLVAGVPQDDVVGRVEHPVQRQRELDGAEVRAEVATDPVHGVDDDGADLLGELIERWIVESAEVRRAVDVVQKHPKRHLRLRVRVPIYDSSPGRVTSRL